MSTNCVKDGLIYFVHDAILMKVSVEKAGKKSFLTGKDNHRFLPPFCIPILKRVIHPPITNHFLLF